MIHFKRILSCTLIVYMIFLSWTPYIVFRHQQHLVRKEMKWHIKNGVPENERITFFASELEKDAANLKWIHNKEFRYRGEMYDILEEQSVNGELVYICIHDVKESGLFAKLDKMVDKGLQTNEPLQTHRKILQHVMSSFFFQNNSQLHITISNNCLLYNYLNTRYTFCLTPPDTPPPEA